MIVAERPAEGVAEGALVLIHGRGANENDLLGLHDALDPERRLHGYCPRGPLSYPPGGAHWYAVRQVGFPDPESFAVGYGALTAWIDSLPHERIVIGGFSQGAVMSFAAGLGVGRPRPAGLLCFSGFIPGVDGWELDTARPFPPIAIGHGTYDPVISVDFGRSARERLEDAGATVLYREAPLDHAIEPAFVAQLQPWLRTVMAKS